MIAMLSILLTLLALSRTSTGPSLPLKMLDGVEPVSVTYGDSWTEGYYAVRYEYHLPASVSQLGEKFKKESFVAKTESYPGGSSFHGDRYGEGITQLVWISRRVLSYVASGPKGRTEGTKEDPYTVVAVYESVRPGDVPARWYPKAVSKEPPVPMVEIPTLPGVVAHTVSLTSFDGLMSSKGIAYVGRDAAVYMATVPGAGEEGRARFEDWAKSNGYSRTRYESWFRAGSGMFEIKFVCDRKGTAYVTVWASERAATHAVVWEKF